MDGLVLADPVWVKFHGDRGTVYEVAERDAADGAAAAASTVPSDGGDGRDAR